MSIRVIDVDKRHEDAFLRYVQKDPFDNYFFLSDWKEDRKNSRFKLALEGERIIGAMVIWMKETVRVTGLARGVAALIEAIDIEDFEGAMPLAREKALLRSFTVKFRAESCLLMARKGKWHGQADHVAEKLDMRDASDYSKILRAAFPESLFLSSKEMVERALKECICMGIKEKGRLVALGSASVSDVGGLLQTIATAKDHRNKGYASSIVSSMLMELFKTRDVVILNVLKDNGPALRVYTKAGFKLYSRSLFFSGCRRIAKDGKAKQGKS